MNTLLLIIIEEWGKKILRSLKRPYDLLESKRLKKKREIYFGELRKFVSPTTSVISSNCFAGRIMQDLGMRYNSPTLGLYFWAEDYLEFLTHLNYYLHEAKPTFVEHSKYKLGDERRSKWKHWYPIGLLDRKVEIQFLHYYTEEEAAEKWYRRAVRVNMNDLLVIGMDQNLCTEKEMIAFDSLPLKRKVFFSSKPVKGDSIVFMKEFENDGQVGDPYKKGHLFYKYLVKYLDKK